MLCQFLTQLNFLFANYLQVYVNFCYNKVMDFEIKIIEFLQAGRSPFFDMAFQILSKLGSVFGVIFILLVFLMFNRKLGVCYLFSYGFVFAFVRVLKHIVARVRPFNVSDTIQNLGGAVQDYSFPSGHAACATAIAIFLAYFLFRYFKSTGARVGISLCCATYLALVCLSRMYLGKHFLTDLIAGVAISAVICVAGILLLRFIEKKLAKKKQFLNGEK